MKARNFSFLVVSLLFSALVAAPALAQDFGFGAESAAETGKATGGLTVGGELSVGASVFLDDLEDLDALGSADLGKLSTARLEFKAAGSSVDASIKLKISDAVLSDDPTQLLDEAALRVYLGPLSLEGGLLKLAWGKADSQGPLDVLNPYDLTDLTVTDTMERKIARPMLHATLALGPLSKLEAVVLPGFEGHRLATSGPWEPNEISELDSTIAYLASAYSIAASQGVTFSDLLPDTSSLDYSQAGFRLTTSVSSIDLGLQYFYGYLPKPASSFTVVSVSPLTIVPSLLYNRYHQVGADAATVLAGFNLRAELAGNITEDLEGDDPSVYNPALAFSLGFDRDLFSGINLNLQYAGSYRLVEPTGGDYDVEADTDALDSTLTAVLSQSLFKDKLEWKFTALVEFDDEDYLLIPSLAWNQGDAVLELAAGLFGGDAGGELGQYADSSYLRATMKYRF